MSLDSRQYMLGFEVSGTAMLMNKPTLMDALHPLARENSQIVAKRNKKTEEDLRRLQQISWEAGLYYNDELGPCVTSDMIEAMIRDGARKRRQGKDIECGLTVDYYFDDKEKLYPSMEIPLLYSGPRQKEKLFKDEQYWDSRLTRLQKSSAVIKTRPIFRNWSLRFVVTCDDEILNRDNVLQAVETAGRYVGLGDYRPKFGRYSIDKFYDVDPNGKMKLAV